MPNQYRTLHGHARGKGADGLTTRLYRTWVMMRQRCNLPDHVSYSRYGGRGIRVCTEWQSDFLAFKNWAEGNGHSDALVLDRVDNDADYGPANCRWITSRESSNNRHNTFLIEAFGERKALSYWLQDPRCAVKRTCLRSRVLSGWNPEAAITTPGRAA